MTEYSASTFSGDNYAKYRPTYPDSFIEHIVNWHFDRVRKGPEQIYVDIGCGTGQVTFPVYDKFHDYFDKVIGIDPGARMVEKCREIKLQKYPCNSAPKLKFYSAFAEDLGELVTDESVDLLTGAECFHWFDHERAFKEIARVLKPNASLVFWFYLDPFIISATTPLGETKAVDGDAYMKIYQKFVFEDERYLGPLWEHPGGTIFRDQCRTIEIPETYYKNIQKRWFYPTVENTRGDSGEKLIIRKKWKLRDYRNMLKSWSTYHRFVKIYEGTGKYDDVLNYIPDTFVGEFKENLGLDEEDELDIVWASVQFYATRK